MPGGGRKSVTMTSPGATVQPPHIPDPGNACTFRFSPARFRDAPTEPSGEGQGLTDPAEQPPRRVGALAGLVDQGCLLVTDG